MPRMLEVDRVRKRFATVDAVSDVSFAVDEGEIFALLGPNGAGKTTLVRMLVGITRPDSGTIRRSGGEPHVFDRARLGYLPEERGLYLDQRVVSTLAYFGTLRGMRRRDADASAMEWLGRLGLSDRAADKIETLSKGNQQRVQIIAAILHRPALVVLDEPFSGLDPIHQDVILDLIQDLRRHGMTVLLSAHQMDLVERLADRVLLLNRGSEVVSGTLESLRARFRGRPLVRLEVDGHVDVEALRSHPMVEDAALEEPGVLRIVPRDEDLGAVLRLLPPGVRVRAIHSERPRLHDIYVRAVRESEAGAASSSRP
jgi:ABC-2 type transport system ATP-binding protein